jgi:hypothetical protein
MYRRERCDDIAYAPRKTLASRTGSQTLEHFCALACDFFVATAVERRDADLGRPPSRIPSRGGRLSGDVNDICRRQRGTASGPEHIMDASDVQARAIIAAALITRGAVEVPAMPSDSEQWPDAAGVRLRELTDYVYRLITTSDPRESR